MTKKNILFVGAFNNRTKDGSTGGQLFACTSLINSDLKYKYNFIKLDTTADVVPAPPVYKRIPKVIYRLCRFMLIIIFKKISCVLIFSSAKFSFVEKGLMSILAQLFLKKVVFAPRSGLIQTDYENSRFMRTYIPLVLRSCTYVLCQSENWKTFYKTISNEKDEKFVVINNWIDINTYIKSKGATNLANIKIIYIGWFEEYKGIKDLLDAAYFLAEKRSDFCIDMYGNGSLFKYAESFVSSHNLEGFVKLKGWADYKTKMLAFNSADIYVLPSHSEGFPNALLEAMASQLSVVASRITAIDDIIVHGYDGLLAECRNPHSLAAQIEAFLDSETLRSELAKNARKTVSNKFTINTAVQKFDKIFN